MQGLGTLNFSLLGNFSSLLRMYVSTDGLPSSTSFERPLFCSLALLSFFLQISL